MQDCKGEDNKCVFYSKSDEQPLDDINQGRCDPLNLPTTMCKGSRQRSSSRSIITNSSVLNQLVSTAETSKRFVLIFGDRALKMYCLIIFYKYALECKCQSKGYAQFTDLCAYPQAFTREFVPFNRQLQFLQFTRKCAQNWLHSREGGTIFSFKEVTV